MLAVFYVLSESTVEKGGGYARFNDDRNKNVERHS